MDAAVGSRIVVEAEKVDQPARGGVIEEILQAQPPRYRVRWDDGHESIISPASGAARIEPAARPGQVRQARARARSRAR
jgi:hypothetical protein